MTIYIFGGNFQFSEKCGVPVGLQDRRIPDSYLTSSSKWDANHGPHRARLNHRNVGGTGAWSSRYNNANQWLQIRLKEVTTITVIATQGRYDANQWVRSFELGSSFDGRRFRRYTIKGKTKVSRTKRSLYFSLSHFS